MFFSFKKLFLVSFFFLFFLCFRFLEIWFDENDIMNSKPKRENQSIQDLVSRSVKTKKKRKSNNSILAFDVLKKDKNEKKKKKREFFSTTAYGVLLPDIKDLWDLRQQNRPGKIEKGKGRNRENK